MKKVKLGRGMKFTFQTLKHRIHRSGDLGTAGHLIVASDCRFHLTTLSGNYLISTVGEWWPSQEVRRIHARIYDPVWHAHNDHRKGDDYDYAYMRRFGFHEIGMDRKYETMVFQHNGRICDDPGCNCGGLPVDVNPGELDYAAYNSALAANEGHARMVQKWVGPVARLRRWWQDYLDSRPW